MSGNNEAEDWTRIDQPDTRKRVQNRLSQRRHRAKVSQQAAPVNQEIFIPSSFTSPPISDENGLVNDHLGPSLSFIGQDERHPMPAFGQSQDAYDPFDGFGPQNFLPSDHTASNRAQQMIPLPSSLHAETSGNPWSSQQSSDRSWANSDIHHHSNPVFNPTHNTTTPRSVSRPLSSQAPRLNSTCTTARISTSNSDRPNTASISPFHIHEMRQSPFERSQASGHRSHNFDGGFESASVKPKSPSRVSSMQQSPLERNRPAHKHGQSHNGLGNANIETIDMHSHDRSGHDQSPHCRLCGALGPLENHAMQDYSPKSATSPQSRSSVHMNSSDNLKILSDCSQALANLARQSTQDNLASNRSLSGSSRKSGRNSTSDYSPSTDHNSPGNGCGETHCQQSVEKVVIVYLQR